MDKCSLNFTCSPSEYVDVYESNNLERKYCICQSNDVDRFMICCDNCDEWYHGDCIGITERSARDIAVFYCDTCKVISPRLKSVYRKNTRSKKELKKKSRNRIRTRFCAKKPKTQRTEFIGEKTQVVKLEDIRSKICDSSDSQKNTEFGKLQTEECLNSNRVIKCEVLSDIEEDLKKINDFPQQHESSGQIKLEVSQSEEVQENNNDVRKKVKYEEYEFVCRKAKAKALSNILSVGKAENTSKQCTTENVRRRKKKSSSRRKEKKVRKEKTLKIEQHFEKTEDVSPPVQCYGPECVNAARKKSKYCSSDCGLKLAWNRIYEILPQRLRQWQATPCAADESNKRSLNEIRQKKHDLRNEIAAVDRRIAQLNDLLREAKNTPQRCVLPGDVEDDDNATLYCKLCGWEISTRVAAKHMENCYRKFESKTIEAERVDEPDDVGWNIFCNAHMGNRNFCKKLRVLCPMHYREVKREEEVCGYPLKKNLTEYSDKFCGALKKNCTRHLGWEGLFRAQLDMDKLHLLTKFGDLDRQEIEIRRAMANRGGLLALMLHQTIVH